MYIPHEATSFSSRPAAQEHLEISAQDSPALGQVPGSASRPCASVIGRILAYLFSLVASPPGEDGRALRRRQFNGDGTHDANVTVGIVVGVLIGVFIIGACVFLWYYRNSKTLRVRHRRRRKSSGSKSSKSSGSSKSSTASDGPPPPPPPPAPEG